MEDYMITFKYEFESGIGEMEGGRYIREFKMSIFSQEETESEKLIGKVEFIFHFESSCGLFVIQAYPLQFEPEEKKTCDWQEQLHLNSFPSNEKIAIKQLRTYYKSFGFDEIPGCKDLLFYNPALINKKMSDINLEE